MSYQSMYTGDTKDYHQTMFFLTSLIVGIVLGLIGGLILLSVPPLGIILIIFGSILLLNGIIGLGCIIGNGEFRFTNPDTGKRNKEE